MRWIRLLLAWGLTFGILAYLWGLISIFALLGGTVQRRLLLMLAATVGGIMVLSWNARPPGRAWGTLAAWVIVNGVLYSLYAAPRMPVPVLFAILLPATVWICWLAWIGAWPMSWPRRLAWQAIWLGCAGIALALLRVEGMTGDTHMVFGWRWADVPTSLVGSPNAVATIVVNPTADDYPQFLGPNRTGVVATKVGTLTERWRRPIGNGWGAFAVVGGYAFTQEQRDESECVVCYRVADGEPQWVHADETKFSGLGGVGPCATPAVAGGRVFSVGGTGILNCLDSATGRRLWRVDLLAEYSAANLGHGVCASPLVDGERVIACPTKRGGPSLAAFHRDDGHKLWEGGTHTAGYASPAIADVAGVSQIVLFNRDGVSGHGRADGHELWHFPWTNNESTNCAQPLVGITGPDRVLAATGYGKGAALFQVKPTGDAWSAEAIWSESKHLKAKYATPVPHGGYVYGLDDGVLACIDPATGKRKWKDGRYGHGQLLLAGDTLIVQAETGEIVLVAPSPDGLREVGRTPAMTEKTWNNPALAGKWLLVRNDREAVCFEVAPEAP
ncbi:MAG: PQQ-binding-like beta-propeller repeat protein [Gemmataceae bacterium]